MSKLYELISQSTGIPFLKVQKTISLLKDKCTIPFIARYRKEFTGSLNEIQISNIQKDFNRLNELIDRKSFIIKTIEEKNQLTPQLKAYIEKTWSSAKLEDLYLPYKTKRLTKSEIARKNGLEPLAKIIMAQRESNLNQRAKDFLGPTIKSLDSALEGARNIISEWINESIRVRDYLREIFEKHATINSKVKSKSKADPEALKFRDYFEHSENLSRIASHRYLAILRAEKLGFIKASIQIDAERALNRISHFFIKSSGACAKQIDLAIQDAYKRLLHPSMETEFKTKAKVKADQVAIEKFKDNLEQLLMAAPTGSQVTFGIDPGFRTGCKLAVLSANSELLEYGSLYPNPPQNQYEESKATLLNLAKKYKPNQIAIGNGTASRETESFIKSVILDAGLDIEVYMVNEAGASIYSASEIAREEFPNIDLTVRGAISIARRLMDPLAELVKIDAKSIGVGQYQHDVNQQSLKNELDQVVSSVVNKVGVNVNTASYSLLSYVSGVGDKLAKNIIDFRTSEGPLKSRTQLKKVKGLGNKSFEQCAGFIKIIDGKNPLDKTFVHPESYHIVESIAKNLNTEIDELLSNNEMLKSLEFNKLDLNDFGKETVTDIINELKKPGLDPRGSAKPFSFSDQVRNISDLISGMQLPGIVNNLTKFGAFVDIGIKESGLIHISNMSDTFVSDPSDILKLGQHITVEVLSIELERNRIQLKLISN